MKLYVAEKVILVTVIKAIIMETNTQLILMGFVHTEGLVFTRWMPKARHAFAQNCTVGLDVKTTCGRPGILFRKSQ